MFRTLTLLCLATFGAAVPVEEAKKESSQIGDVQILNYALTLEFLERAFYVDGLKNYTANDFAQAGFGRDVYDKLVRVRDDEKAHVKFLSGALGSKAIAEPKFSFPYSNPHDFVGLASVLEGVGVAAYLGAAASITNKEYLSAAGSILTVEARHSSYLRSILGEEPTPTPYDTSLDFNQVFSLAAAFTTFPPGTKLPFKAFPTLTATSSNKNGKFCPGKGSITFKKGKEPYNGKGKVYAVLYSGQQTYYVPAESSGSNTYTAKMPGEGYASKDEPAPAGQVYAILSTADGKETKASDENTIAGVAILEVASRC
ncbi:hypothetical protein XA68_18091 [Ophiocordyceps unilateralis]|uniref:Ferritin-like diiron domain-containing protein n=1 Tax=Ophiocordyceps unilateralis TaxID=268505 RepID=A0A2A9PJC5_OPHUN|nr:hypothetical protein XA68_18091 [Ophiocordyceps unilateralis]